MIDQLLNFSVKKIFLYFSLLMSSVSLNAQNWTYDTLSEKKISMAVAVNGNKIFFHGGSKMVGSSQVYVNQVDIFDIQTGTRTTVPLPAGSPARTQAATAVVGSKALFAGGDMGDATNWVDIYDTLTGSWTTTSLSLDRWFLAGTSANGKAFFGGGYSTSISNYGNVDVYNENTGTWTQAYFPKTKTRMLAAATIGNKVFFAGGDVGNPIDAQNWVQIFDAVTNQWLPSVKLSQRKSYLSSIIYNNKIYFTGGWAGSFNNASDTIDIYDNTTDTWSTMKIPRLMKAYTGKKRAYIQSAQAGCKMFLVPYPDGNGGFGGMDPGNGDTIAVYDFARDTWSYLPLPHPRTQVTIAAAKNKVYFAGGGSITYATNGQRFNHIDILTLEPKLQLAINSIPSTQHDFGTVILGEEETTNINLSNEGDYDLLFDDLPTRITVTGDVGDFTIDQALLESTDTLSPAEIISLPVTFNPTNTGIRQITISVYSNDPENPVYTFTVQGTGEEATAVKNPSSANLVQVYPNPSTGLIKIESTILDDLYVQIVNGQGIVIRKKELLDNNIIDISSLPEGLYFLKISNEKFSEVVKVVKR